MSDLSDLRDIVDKLEQQRWQLARLEATRHEARVEAFMQDASRTVKEREMAGEAVTLGLNRDILMLRAEIRSLEDRLRVELNHDAVDA